MNVLVTDILDHLKNRDIAGQRLVLFRQMIFQHLLLQNPWNAWRLTWHLYMGAAYRNLAETELRQKGWLTANEKKNDLSKKTMEQFAVIERKKTGFFLCPVCLELRPTRKSQCQNCGFNPQDPIHEAARLYIDYLGPGLCVVKTTQKPGNIVAVDVKPILYLDLQEITTNN